MASASAPFDLVLYGATGFTGLLTAEYLASSIELRRWAVAGRSRDKLEAVKASLTGPAAERAEVVVCDLSDASAVEALVRSARVVLSAAGPYSTNGGAALLGACARLGVHYSDLSGETFWQRRMIDEWHEAAVASGAKIVLGGGVDSIPSDLGCLLALEAVRPEPGHLVDVRAIYKQFSGAFSGGTLNSGRAVISALKSGQVTKDALRDPYLLAPGVAAGPDQTADGHPMGWRWKWDEKFGGIICSFFMAEVNARVVRRSLALRNVAEQCSYSEAASAGMYFRILWLYLRHGFGHFVGEPLRFSPKSGEGPPSWCLKKGSFQVELSAVDRVSQQSASVEVAGAGDPGYGATSKMFAEVGLGLAFDTSRLPQACGVLTPSTAMAHALVDRLQRACGGQFMSFRRLSKL